MDNISTQKNIAIKNSSEERESLRIKTEINKICNISSRWYYASIILLAIISLIVAFLILDNSGNEIQKISTIFESFDYKLLCILIVCFFILLLLKTLPVFLRIFSKSKSKNYLTVFGGVVASEFYSRVTICAKGKNPTFAYILNKRGMANDVAIDCVYGKSFNEKFSFLIYSLVIMLIGIFAWSKNTNVLLLVIGIIVLLVNLINVVFVLMFNVNKKKTLEQLSKIIRLAYSINLIKDYEKVYNSTVDKLIIAVKDLKTNKSILFVDFISNILRYFLMTGVIYVSIVSLNFADGSILGELLFKYVILKLILDAWPLQKGMFIVEIIFIILFKNLFFEGYVFWGLVFYRLIDYFAYIIAFCIYKIFATIKDNKIASEENLKRF